MFGECDSNVGSRYDVCLMKISSLDIKIEKKDNKRWTLKKINGTIVTKTFEGLNLNVTCAVYCRGIIHLNNAMYPRWMRMCHQ